jgi:hypothetical protein
LKKSSLVCLSTVAGALGLAIILAAGGCDGERSDPSAMIMQPTAQGPAPATRPATQPDGELAEDGTPVPVYISIDGEPYEFPPARLWLKRTGDRVRARLLSDDPPEALERDWNGDSFFFEMDMELPPSDGLAGEPVADVGGEVSARDLASAEWIFRNESTERADTRSGIFLGGQSHLQPISVSVLFDPLPDGKTVMVTLVGVFADFDQARPEDKTARRQVRVQAALPADAINR